MRTLMLLRELMLDLHHDFDESLTSGCWQLLRCRCARVSMEANPHVLASAGGYAWRYSAHSVHSAQLRGGVLAALNQALHHALSRSLTRSCRQLRRCHCARGSKKTNPHALVIGRDRGVAEMEQRSRLRIRSIMR